MRFQDREHAGRLLAARLEGFRSERPVVLGLTSGGIPVAFEVARLLEAPLEMVVVRRVGAPGRSDFTVGAIAEGGETFVNPLILRETGLPEEDAARLAEDEVAELTRRVRMYRAGRPLPHVADRTVLVVDDGVATGASARAAGRAVRQRKARRVAFAAPVIASGAAPELRHDFDEVIALETPARLGAIGDWYERFAKVSDDDVLKYLRRAETELAAGLP
jgi:putative phosphoribosyl transferase